MRFLATRDGAAWQRLPLPLLLVVAGLVLYVATLAPTVLWGDDAELQRIVVTGETRIVGESSNASHRLWLAITPVFVRSTAWLPLDRAGRTNLVSALLGALALPCIYAAAVEMARGVAPRPRVAGLVAAAAYGLSHTFWLLSVRPAVYTLQIMLLALATWLVLRWRRTGEIALLALAAVICAAALTNHAMILAAGPALALLAVAVPAKFRPRLGVGLVLAAVLAGVALLVAGSRGVPLGDLWHAVAGFRPVPPSPLKLAATPAYLLYQFPLAILLAPWGVRALWRHDRVALAAIALFYTVNLVMALLLPARDQFIFFLPSYFPVALLLGIGAAALVAPDPIRHRGRLTGRLRGRPRALVVAVAVLAPFAVYPLATAIGGAAASRLAPARTLPGRDPIAFYLFPGKTGYLGARRYGEAAMNALAPQAAVVGDWLPYQTLRYLQAVEGRRPDVLLEQINAGQSAQLRFLLQQQKAQRPVYVADSSPYPYYEMDDIQKCFVVAREGVVYRLTPRQPAPPDAVLCGG